METLGKIAPYIALAGGVAMALITLLPNEYKYLQKHWARSVKGGALMFAAAILFEGISGLIDNPYPYILPHFDSDATRVFIHNDASKSAYIVYHEFSMTEYYIDGSSSTFVKKAAFPLEVPKRSIQWVGDFNPAANIKKVSFSYAGNSRNGGFSSGFEISVSSDSYVCSVTNGPMMGRPCP